MELPVPYAVFPMLAPVAPDRVALLSTEEYAIRIIAPDGSTERVIRGRSTRVRMSDQYRSLFARNLGDSSLAQHLSFPEVLPSVRGLVGSRDGSILAKTYWETPEWVQWDRWSVDGRALRPLLLPAALKHVTVWQDVVAGVLEDSWGEQSIGIFEVSGSVACPAPRDRN